MGGGSFLPCDSSADNETWTSGLGSLTESTELEVAYKYIINSFKRNMLNKFSKYIKQTNIERKRKVKLCSVVKKGLDIINKREQSSSQPFFNIWVKLLVLLLELKPSLTVPSPHKEKKTQTQDL